MKISPYYTLTSLAIVVASLVFNVVYHADVHAESMIDEPVQACVLLPGLPMDAASRANYAQCLGWQKAPASRCGGYYQSIAVTPLGQPNEIHMLADEASLYAVGQSQLNGHVEIRQSQRVVNAQTATVYRDEKTKQVTEIVLLGNVRYLEPGRMMWAKKVSLNPHDKSGKIDNVLYRFNLERAGAVLPAWGRANFVQRFANQDYLLRNVTYTTCSPQDKAWQLEASEITLDAAKNTGVARNALLRVGEMPIFYAPYFSFPTSNQRKSGFLMPIGGYSNVGGFDAALPYYWNIAPNYDATLVPHLYTERGLMMGGDFRFLTQNSAGIVGGNFLANDRAFNSFLTDNRAQYPSLDHVSSDRWSLLLHETTHFNPNLQMNINYQQVSDDYYLQDFSTNLAFITENQLLRQGDITYNTDHWLLRGMLQSYQTLHPINQSVVANVYERLPQLLARGSYTDLPLHANFNVLSQFDYFHNAADREFSSQILNPSFTSLPSLNASTINPQGPRYHLNPVLSLPQTKPWGYITPEVQVIENNYNLNYGHHYNAQSFNYTIPRYSVDSGLSFERSDKFAGHGYTQTLEPRLYYLYVPYQNQSAVPAFDSAYMIFNTDQLFRNNRFSGFDRIGDTNQFSYAATTRWISAVSGREKASLSIGQIKYFSKRQTQLCYSKDGHCTDSSLFLGYLSPLATTSPVATNANYHLGAFWTMNADYVWDTFEHATNNADLNVHYQPGANQIISFGYSYLINGNIIALQNDAINDNALHQATFAYAWPFTEKWSSLGAYSYNISKGYGMMTFLGVQYDSCCWAARLLGGHTFKSLSPNSMRPEYNNNVYLQILLKGLGSVANSDPATTIQSYLPGYANIFQH